MFDSDELSRHVKVQVLEACWELLRVERVGATAGGGSSSYDSDPGGSGADDIVIPEKWEQDSSGSGTGRQKKSSERKVYWITEELIRLLLEEIVERVFFGGTGIFSAGASLRTAEEVRQLLEKARDRYATRTGWQSYRTSINRLDWISPKQMQQLEQRLRGCLVGSDSVQVVNVTGESTSLAVCGRQLAVSARLDIPDFASPGSFVPASGQAATSAEQRASLCQVTCSADPKPAKIDLIRLALETLCQSSSKDRPETANRLSGGAPAPKRRKLLDENEDPGPPSTRTPDRKTGYLFNVRRNALWRVSAKREDVIKVAGLLFGCMIASAAGPSDADFLKTAQEVAEQYGMQEG